MAAAVGRFRILLLWTILFVSVVFNAAAIPGPPTNLLITNSTATTLDVAWSTPAAGPPPRYYRIRWYGSDTYGDEQVPTLGHTIKGLSPCNDYSITVAAIDDNVEGTKAWINGQTGSLVPPAPANCTISRPTARTISVAWAKPDTPCKIWTYNISWRWEASWADGLTGEDSTLVGNTGHVIRKLTPASHVVVALAAMTSAGYGGIVTCQGDTLEDVPSTPNLTRVDEGSNYLHLTWIPPEQANGVLLGYRMKWNGTEGSGYQDIEDGAATSGIVSGLKPCTSYDLTVSAKTSKGYGTPSNKITVWITAQAPLEEVRCVGMDAWNFTVEWDHSDFCTQGEYDVWWHSQVLWSDEEASGQDAIPGTMTDYEMEAMPYTFYDVCVAIMDAGHDPQCCNHTTPMDAPSSPTIDEVIALRGMVNLSWSPPEVPNGLITNYTVSWRAIGGAEAKEEFGNMTEAIVGPLGACKVYVFTVKGKTNVWGPPSAESQNVTVYNYVSRVSCVTGFMQVKIEYELINLECQVPLNRTYSVFVLWNNESCTHSNTWYDRPTTGSDLISLPSWAQVDACWAMAGRDHEAMCCTNTTLEDVPECPRNVTITAIRDTNATIAWSPPRKQNGRLSHYLVSWRAMSDADWTNDTVGGQVTSHDLDSLRARTHYLVEVKARTGAGWGPERRAHFDTTGPTELPSGAPKAVIVVAIVGGVGVLGAAGVGGLFVYRRRRRRGPMEAMERTMDGQTKSSHGTYGQSNRDIKSQVRDMSTTPELGVAILAQCIIYIQNKHGASTWQQ